MALPKAIAEAQGKAIKIELGLLHKRLRQLQANLREVVPANAAMTVAQHRAIAAAVGDALDAIELAQDNT